MNKITTYSNWCEFDQLDGRTLLDGERLRIEWPDGSITEGPIKVKKTSYPINDMGVQTTIPVIKAYRECNYRGHILDLPIVGLKATRL